ncbi:MAG: ABC transporter substrate-binding protein, partial [Lachnospiraceae bacterium]|nr:ABC transporter substrate-binding protein [Lachnospiraceae bacterium]
MKKNKLLSILLSFVLLISMFTSGCSSKAGDSDSAKKVVLNEVAHSIFYAPMYVAIEEGYFADEGINLELVTGYGADKTMTALLTGEADIGFMGSEASVYT